MAHPRQCVTWAEMNRIPSIVVRSALRSLFPKDLLQKSHPSLVALAPR